MSGKIALTAEEMEELFAMYEHVETWASMAIYKIKITKKGNLKITGYEWDDE